MSTTLIDGGMKVAGAAFDHAFKMLLDAPKGESLVSYAQAGIIEPSCLVDEAVRNDDTLPDLLQMAQSVYTAYYLRAFSMHNISVGGVSVQQRLDKFSTRRSTGVATTSVIGSIARIANEEYDDRLPVDGDVRELPQDIQDIENEVRKSMDKETVALEAHPTIVQHGKDAVNKIVNANNGKGGSTSFSKAVDISEPVNMGTGRMVNVTIKDGDREVQVPVLIRMNAMYMASNPLINILSYTGEDITMGARFRKWRLGGIDFWRDFVLQQDLIDAHKKNLKADKTGMYLQIMQKRRQNNIASAITASVSANNASNIIVLSEESAKELELKIFGKLSDFNTRQKLFQQGYSMLLFVVSRQWGTVRMYTRDIPEFTELSARDIASTKKNGVDIGDVLAAYRTGASPRM